MKHNVGHQLYECIAPRTVQHCRKEFHHKLEMSARRQMDLAQVAREMGNNTNMEMTFPYCQIENDIYKFLEAASFARMAESQRVW